MYWRQPHYDYIDLPADARMRNTRFRWWQMVDHGALPGPVGWSLDDVYIGGSEINPSYMQSDFNGGYYC